MVLLNTFATCLLGLMAPSLDAPAHLVYFEESLANAEYIEVTESGDKSNQTYTLRIDGDSLAQLQQKVPRVARCVQLPLGEVVDPIDPSSRYSIQVDMYAQKRVIFRAYVCGKKRLAWANGTATVLLSRVDPFVDQIVNKLNQQRATELTSWKAKFADKKEFTILRLSHRPTAAADEAVAAKPRPLTGRPAVCGGLSSSCLVSDGRLPTPYLFSNGDKGWQDFDLQPVTGPWQNLTLDEGEPDVELAIPELQGNLTFARIETLSEISLREYNAHRPTIQPAYPAGSVASRIVASTECFVASEQANSLTVLNYKRFKGGASHPVIRQIMRGTSETRQGLKHPSGLALCSRTMELYVISQQEQTLAVFRLDKKRGKLEQKQLFSASVAKNAWRTDFCETLISPRSIVAAPDGEHVYVACGGNEAILCFDHRIPKGGVSKRLTFQDSYGDAANPLSQKLGLREVTALALSPDGNNLYVVGEQNVISVWQRDLINGRLKFVERIDSPRNLPKDLGPISDLAVSPDGNSVVAIYTRPSVIALYKRLVEQSGILDLKLAISETEPKFAVIRGAQGLSFAADDSSIVHTTTDDHTLLTLGYLTPYEHEHLELLGTDRSFEATLEAKLVQGK